MRREPDAQHPGFSAEIGGRDVDTNVEIYNSKSQAVSSCMGGLFVTCASLRAQWPFRAHSACDPPSLDFPVQRLELALSFSCHVACCSPAEKQEIIYGKDIPYYYTRKFLTIQGNPLSCKGVHYWELLSSSAMYTYIHICICTHMCVYIYIYVYVYVCLYVYR